MEDTPALSAVILEALTAADGSHTEYVIQVSQVHVTSEATHYETMLGTVRRRYSQFAKLHHQLAPTLGMAGKVVAFPAPKRLIQSATVRRERVKLLQRFLDCALSALAPNPSAGYTSLAQSPTALLPMLLAFLDVPTEALAAAAPPPTPLTPTAAPAEHGAAASIQSASSNAVESSDTVRAPEAEEQVAAVEEEQEEWEEAYEALEDDEVGEEAAAGPECGACDDLDVAAEAAAEAAAAAAAEAALPSWMQQKNRESREAAAAASSVATAVTSAAQSQNTDEVVVLRTRVAALEEELATEREATRHVSVA